MDWVEHYYSRKAEWFGPTGIFPEHRARAEIVTRLCGPGRRVLELGAGAGGTAAAMADLGHEVVALELSPVRAAQARDLAREREGRLRVLEVDFYTVDLDGRFDVVCCWDGFGIGADAEQRRLLRRVAGEWLNDNGAMLMDVFSPWAWLRRAGHEERLDRIWRLVDGRVGTVGLETAVKVRYGFDTAAAGSATSTGPSGGGLRPSSSRFDATRPQTCCYC